MFDLDPCLPFRYSKWCPNRRC